MDTLDFARDNFRWLGAAFLILFLSCFGQTFYIGLAGVDLRARFAMTDGAFGGLYVAATLASGLTLPWIGRTMDLLPASQVVRFSLLGLAIGCILLAYAPNVTLLGLAFYLQRLFGQGMLVQVTYTELSRWFIANRGRALALVNPGLQAGAALLPIGFVAVHALGGWRAPWIVSAAILLLSVPLLLMLLSIDRQPQGGVVTTSGKSRLARDWTRKEALADPVFYMLMVGMMAAPLMGTMVLFHQGYLIELRHYDPLVFAGSFSLMACTVVVFGFVAGAHVDRFGSIRLLPYFLLPMVLATFAIGWIAETWGLYLYMLLLGVGNGYVNTLFASVWPEVYGASHLGAIRSLSVSAMVVATAAGPGLMGVAIDHGVPFSTQMTCLALWALASCVLLFFAAHAIEKRNALQE